MSINLVVTQWLNWRIIFVYSTGVHTQSFEI